MLLQILAPQEGDGEHLGQSEVVAGEPRPVPDGTLPTAALLWTPRILNKSVKCWYTSNLSIGPLPQSWPPMPHVSPAAVACHAACQQPDIFASLYCGVLVDAILSMSMEIDPCLTMHCTYMAAAAISLFINTSVHII